MGQQSGPPAGAVVLATACFLILVWSPRLVSKQPAASRAYTAGHNCSRPTADPQLLKDPDKHPATDKVVQVFSYTPSVEAALRQAQSHHPSNYFRDLAAAVLAAPRITAAARRPYMCNDRSGQSEKNIASTSSARIALYPISFSIPAAFYQSIVPAKGQNFSYVIPGLPETYRYKPDTAPTAAGKLAMEDAYHQDMARSLFAVTYKKAGWDCLRHSEIIAAGALPIFTDIAALPAGTMAAYPLEVMRLLNKWPGLVLKGFPGTPAGPGGQNRGKYIVGEVVRELSQPVDRAMYHLVAEAMLQYGVALLSTKAMATSLLDTAGIKPDDRVLFFGSERDSDYQADTLLHGLQSVMAVPVVDWPRTEGVYRDVTTFTEEELASCKGPRYAGGFTFAYRIHEPFGINRTGVEEKLQNPAAHFDFIIVGVTHRDAWRRAKICGRMPRKRVVFVYGADFDPPMDLVRELHACSAYIFTREMNRGCTLVL